MPFFPVDDDFTWHAKARAAGNAAVGLWTRAGAYCMKQANGGVLARHELEGMGKPTEARRLVEVVLWHAHGHDCDRCPQPPKGGWVFHDWTDVGRLKTPEAIKADREAARERMRKHRQSAGNSDVRANAERTGDATNDARSATPSPSPGPVVVTPVSQSPTEPRDEPGKPGDGLTDDDIEKIRQRLGTTTPSYARQVATEILSRSQATGLKPRRYVLAAIDTDPDRYKPTHQAPRKDDSCPLPGHGSYLATNCGACRSETIGKAQP